MYKKSRHEEWRTKYRNKKNLIKRKKRKKSRNVKNEVQKWTEIWKMKYEEKQKYEEW